MLLFLAVLLFCCLVAQLLSQFVSHCLIIQVSSYFVIPLSSCSLVQLFFCCFALSSLVLQLFRCFVIQLLSYLVVFISFVRDLSIQLLRALCLYCFMGFALFLLFRQLVVQLFRCVVIWFVVQSVGCFLFARFKFFVCISLFRVQWFMCFVVGQFRSLLISSVMSLFSVFVIQLFSNICIQLFRFCSRFRHFGIQQCRSLVVLPFRYFVIQVIRYSLFRRFVISFVGNLFPFKLFLF